MTEHLSRFQAGGNLSQDALYVRRGADDELWRDLQKGLLRCILAPRQSGKTSLATRTIASLKQAGVCSARVDLSGIGTYGVRDSAHWAGAVLEKLHLKLCPNESPEEFHQLWKRSSSAPLSSRCIDYFRSLLAKIPGPLVCFLDEVDAVRSLAEGVSADDLFAAIRTLHDERDQRPELARLNFCLLGVASAGELMQDARRTPFNVAQEFTLSDFEYDEAAPAFCSALRQHGVIDVEARFDEVFAWTSGHPYLTHLLCNEIALQPTQAVDTLVESLFLRPGQTLNPNLQQAEERLDRSVGRDRTAEMLHLYQKVLSGQAVIGQRTSRAQDELYLCGLCRWQDGKLIARNRVYTTVLGAEWVKERLEFGDGYGWFDQALGHWLENGMQRGFLLQGPWLQKAQSWAERHELTVDQQSFLLESLDVEAKDRLAHAEERRLVEVAIAQKEMEVTRAEKRLFIGLSLALVTLILGGVFSSWRILAKERWARKFAEDSQRVTAGNLVLEREKADALSMAKQKTEDALRTEQQLLKSEKAGANALLLAKQKTEDALRTEQQLLKSEKARVYALSIAEQRSEETHQLQKERADSLALAAKLAIDKQVQLEGRLVAEAELRATTERLLATEQIEKERFKISSTVMSYLQDAREIQEAMLKEGPHLDLVAKSIPIVYAALNRTKEDHLLKKADPNQCAMVVRAAEMVQAAVLPAVSHRLGGAQRVRAAAFSSIDSRIATAGDDGRVTIWDALTMRRLSNLPGHAKTIVDVGFSADGAQLFTSGLDASVRVWRSVPKGGFVEKAPVVQPYAKHRQWAAAFSPDGNTIAAVGDRGTANLWDLRNSGRRVFESSPVFNRPTETFAEELPVSSSGERYQELSLYTVAFSPDGRSVAAGGNDGKVRLWDVASGSTIWTSERHGDEVRTVAFSPRGEILVSSGTDQKIKVWDVHTGKLQRELGPRLGPVTALAFSSDGRFFADGTKTGHVRVADATNDKPVLEFYPHRSTVRSISFVPHGSGELLTASLDGSAQIYPLDPVGYLRFACEKLRADELGLYRQVETECQQVLTTAESVPTGK